MGLETVINKAKPMNEPNIKKEDMHRLYNTTLDQAMPLFEKYGNELDGLAKEMKEFIDKTPDKEDSKKILDKFQKSIYDMSENDMLVSEINDELTELKEKIEGTLTPDCAIKETLVGLYISLIDAHKKGIEGRILSLRARGHNIVSLEELAGDNYKPMPKDNKHNPAYG